MFWLWILTTISVKFSHSPIKEICDMQWVIPYEGAENLEILDLNVNVSNVSYVVYVDLASLASLLFWALTWQEVFISEKEKEGESKKEKKKKAYPTCSGKTAKGKQRWEEDMKLFKKMCVYKLQLLLSNLDSLCLVASRELKVLDSLICSNAMRESSN